MREIKFRGKRIDTGKWIFGSLIKDEHNNCYIGEFIEAKEDGRQIITFGRQQRKTLNRFAAMGFSMVDPETVGQCFSIDGKEFCEGDIIRETDYFQANYLVVYGEETARFIGVKLGDRDGNTLSFPQLAETGEIIGNKWDDPFLLP